MPDPTNAAARCPICGAAIPADAPVTGGNPACPACLLGAGVPTGGRVADAPSAAEVAAAFPDLEIAGLLGRGGMGVVWKARQKGLDRLVALKVLPKDVARVPGFAERFQREARALARLTHPNIVGVHEFGERGGIYFLVLEYVDGTNARQAMREGRIAAAAALRIVPQICDALQYAHEHGVVHRDIKPENVLLDREGHVKVTDFGLAKILGSDGDRPELTVTGQVMGTLHYMAPEQFEKPATVDHRADIYSLGVVFYEMLTGELPLGRFPPPSQKFHLDVRLDDVVLRSLEKAPERRWQHAVDVKSRVGSIGAGAESTARGVRPRTAAVRPDTGWLPSDRLLRLSLMFAFLTISTGSGALLGLGGNPAPWWYVVFVAAVSAVAFCGGVVSWFRINRSRGALRGLGLAILSTLVPVLGWGIALPFTAFLVQLTERRIVREGVIERTQDGEAIMRALRAGADPETVNVGYVAVARLKALSDRSPAAIVRLYCREDREETFRFIPGLPGNLEPRSDLGLPWLVRDWPADRLARLLVTTQETRDKLQIPRDGNLWRVTAVEGDDAYTFDVVVEDGEPKFRATPVVVTSKSGGPPK